MDSSFSHPEYHDIFYYDFFYTKGHVSVHLGPHVQHHIQALFSLSQFLFSALFNMIRAQTWKADYNQKFLIIKIPTAFHLHSTSFWERKKTYLLTQCDSISTAAIIELCMNGEMLSRCLIYVRRSLGSPKFSDQLTPRSFSLFNSIRAPFFSTGFTQWDCGRGCRLYAMIKPKCQLKPCGIHAQGLKEKRNLYAFQTIQTLRNS